MPVSHLGLTVSHVPSSTSFYLAALQPLGYRYVGQRGDSVGLGINDADFFLSESKNRSKISPTHVAFAADSSTIVQRCYIAALNAGGHPSGPPGTRNNDCDCFNAAVLDLDGNTVEFIFRQSDEVDSHYAPSMVSRSSRPRGYDDDLSVASKASRAKSRTQTALDLASQISKSSNQSAKPAPSPGITRSRTEPASTESGGKAIFGTVLGAAAGVFVAYAMSQSERESARDEREYNRSRASSPRSGRSRSTYERPSASRPSTRRSASSRRERPAIESPRYTNEYDDLMSRHPSRRPAPQRSRTYDAIEYPPRSIASSRNDRYSMKRASTLPTDGQEYIPTGAWTAPASRHTSRRGSLEDKSALKRHDSAQSMHSHRSSSHRPGEGSSHRSSTSKISTVKPYGRNSVYEPAAGVPLPYSKAGSYVTASQTPLPSSRATSYVSASQRPRSRADSGFVDGVGYESDGLGDSKTVVPEDSISCIDFSTKSSKSDKGKKSSRSGSKRSEAPSNSTVRRIKPESRYSAQTAPAPVRDGYDGGGRRRRRDEGRSAYSYA